MKTTLATITKDLTGRENPVTALYPSARRDTRPFTFLHPDHLAIRGAADVPAPEVFVFIDADEYAAPTEPLWFRDDRTEIRGRSRGSIIIVNDLICAVEWVEVRSDRMATREVPALRFLSRNDEFGIRAAREGWTPDHLITVCCGCAGFGGNWRCEADGNLSGAAAGLGPGHRYLTTDHLRHTINPTSFELCQRAFLSGIWRGPHGGESLDGATLFEVVPTTPSLSAENLSESHLESASRNPDAPLPHPAAPHSTACRFDKGGKLC